MRSELGSLGLSILLKDLVLVSLALFLRFLPKASDTIQFCIVMRPVLRQMLCENLHGVAFLPFLGQLFGVCFWLVSECSPPLSPALFFQKLAVFTGLGYAK